MWPGLVQNYPTRTSQLSDYNIIALIVFPVNVRFSSKRTDVSDCSIRVYNDIYVHQLYNYVHAYGCFTVSHN